MSHDEKGLNSLIFFKGLQGEKVFLNYPATIIATHRKTHQQIVPSF